MRALALTHESRDVAATDPMRSLILAREALRTRRTPATVSTLRDRLRKLEIASAVLRGHDEGVTDVDVSRDGRLVATASGDRTARVWTTDGREQAVLEGHDGPVLSARFSPDGTRVLTSSADGSARVFGADGEPGPVLRGHEGAGRSAAFSPDGTRIVTASTDAPARIWDVEGREIAVLPGAMSSSAVFSADGSLILAATGLFATDGRQVARLAGQEDIVTARFSPDGTRVVTASLDGTARIWDTAGRLLDELRGHEDRVSCATFSPDGSSVITGSSDRTARIWLVSVDHLVALADARITRNLTADESERYEILLHDD